MRNLHVESPNNVIATVYIDSTYIGNTPIDTTLNQDSVEGAELRVFHQGEILLKKKLKKQGNEYNENQMTATGIGLVASGAAMLAMPFSLAILAPVIILPTSSIIASAITPDSSKNSWTFYPASPQKVKKENHSISGTKDSSTEKDQVSTKGQDHVQKKASKKEQAFSESNISPDGLHDIERRLFWLDKEAVKKDFALITPVYPVAGNNLVLSDGVCYDESNKTIWFRSEDNKKTYPIPLESLYNKCISLTPSQKMKKKSFWTPVLITTGIGAGLGALLGGDEATTLAAGLGGAGFFYSLLAMLIIGDRYTVDGEDDGICPLEPPNREDLEKWFLQYPCSGSEATH